MQDHACAAKSVSKCLVILQGFTSAIAAAAGRIRDRHMRQTFSHQPQRSDGCPGNRKSKHSVSAQRAMRKVSASNAAPQYLALNRMEAGLSCQQDASIRLLK